MTAGCLILRTIGLVRAKVKIGLRSLAYNYESVQNIGRKWDLVERRREKPLGGIFLTRSSTLY